MRSRSLIAAGLIWALAWRGAVGQDLLPLPRAVVFNNNGRTPPAPNVYPLFRLSEHFALFEAFYTPANIDAAFVTNLQRSRLLYIGQYSDEGPLFADPELCRELRSHLEQGGLIFFDYHTGTGQRRFRPETEAFLKSVGVAVPDGFQPGYGSSGFAAPEVHAMLAGPVPIGGKAAGHYGWFQQWSPEQTVLARDRNDEGRATLLAQDGVAGKGTVVFSQLPSVFRSDAGVSFDLVRNVIAYAYATRRSP